MTRPLCLAETEVKMRTVTREGRPRRSSYDRRAMECMRASAGYISASCEIPSRSVMSPYMESAPPAGDDRTRESSHAAGGLRFLVLLPALGLQIYCGLRW